MSWRINQIEVKNFKFFKNTFTLNIDRKNILLYGENGSGKSSIYWSVIISDIFFRFAVQTTKSSNVILSYDVNALG
jgi:recombinational DNA repair ATPase RecF